MKKIKHVLMGAAALAALVGCDDNTTTPPVDGGNVLTDAYVPPEPGQCHLSTSACVVTESISGDTTWSTGATITLSTRVYVTGNATLTIQPGVTVKGALGSALVVTRGSHLVAEGTAAAPIVFTSSATVGTRQPADWGGIVLFGRAPTNQGADVVFEGLAADERHTYGGTDEAWDCGSLRYVRVEFGGQLFSAGREFNGITVAGCGSETQLSYIQVHLGSDDGIEFFGGTAGMDHVVVTGASDDSLDWDLGWTGDVQFLVTHQFANLGDRAIEADNLGSNEAATPRSNPRIYNATIIGGTATNGILLREGTRGTFRNFIIANVPGSPIDLAATTNDLTTEWPTQLSFERTFFFNNGAVLETADTNDNGFDESAALMLAARNNVFGTDPMLGSTSTTAPNYVPANTALNGQATPPAGFDTTATYAGAFAPNAASPWTAGWTSFPAN